MRRILSLLLASILVIAGYSQEVISLYTDSLPNGQGDVFTEADNPTLTIYLPPKEKSTGTGIIIFPGGAYGFHAFNEEGIEIAKAFSQKGVAAFVVRYRLPNEKTMREKWMVPLMDAQQAIKVVRENAKEYGIDGNKIGIIGFSAGGHLASTLGTHFSTSYIPNKEITSLRPDFMILVYPVISMDSSLTHKGSRRALLGNNPSFEKLEFFSNEKQVTASTPPTYLTHTGDDGVVKVGNSIVFYEACVRNKVDAELHLYPKGNHGFTQRLSVNEWLDPMLKFLKKEGFYKEQSHQ